MHLNRVICFSSLIFLDCSDEENISGLMVHVKANIGDRCYSHTNGLEVEPWSCSRQQLHIIDMGNLIQSEYILNLVLIPPYVIQYQVYL